jgi:hypothetical protein
MGKRFEKTKGHVKIILMSMKWHGYPIGLLDYPEPMEKVFVKALPRSGAKQP